MDKSHYYLIHSIDTLFADPVTAMIHNSKLVIIGTMKGILTMYNMQSKETKELLELSNEHISSLSFCGNDDLIYASIGDEEVLEYKEKTIATISPPLKHQIYRNELEHNKYCQNSYLMSSQSGGIIFRLVLPTIDELSKEIEVCECAFDYKLIQVKETKSGTIIMTSYTIPFDFDGARLLWVEYHSKTIRKICVANVPNSEKLWKYVLNESFGHISQAKLLKDNRVFIVRKMNQCEIRRIDQCFSLEASFKNIGEEVISVYLYYYDKSRLNTEDIANKVQIHQDIEEYYMRINLHSNNRDNKESNGNGSSNKPKESEVILNNESKIRREEDNFIIVILDVNGNVNHYENKKIVTKFNLFNIEGITKEHKEKKFFVMGYPYYIRYYEGVYCISSDNGCYIITNQKV